MDEPTIKCGDMLACPLCGKPSCEVTSVTRTGALGSYKIHRHDCVSGFLRPLDDGGE